METQSDKWNPDFLCASPLFFPLQEVTALLTDSRQFWPGLDDFQNILTQLPQPPKSLNGKNIRFVPQAPKSNVWTEDYEPRIYLKGEVQTRVHNWHDFFQVLIWAAFPRTKAVLNAKHYEAIAHRITSTPHNKRRTPMENALTQFDECGAIIVTADAQLAQLIREFSWKELFWHHRPRLKNKLQCFVFGHAIYEKALKPYQGLTAHAIVSTVAEEFFQWPMRQQLEFLDHFAAEAFHNERYATPKSFQPFPVLGMPGWDKNNNRESYYNNVDYFRPGRSKSETHYKTP
jgi:hypothetical protein